MSVALVFPPSCDPTAPMLALPTLTAALRKAGEEVWQLDANLEAAEWLLTEETLARAEQRLNKRLNRLDRAEKLRHPRQRQWLKRGGERRIGSGRRPERRSGRGSDRPAHDRLGQFRQ